MCLDLRTLQALSHMQFNLQNFKDVGAWNIAVGPSMPLEMLLTGDPTSFFAGKQFRFK
jgi:hypothetical protein